MPCTRIPRRASGSAIRHVPIPSSSAAASPASAAAPPFLTPFPLERHGVEWIESPAALAHPFDDGSAALLCRSIEKTAATLGGDGERYRRLMGPLARDSAVLLDALLRPLGAPRH